MKDKLYVRVCARADEHGVITPEAFTLNGHTLPITRVVERRETRQTKYGGQGTRYLVRVGQNQACLYRDDDRRWYVEDNEDVRQVSHFNGG